MALWSNAQSTWIWPRSRLESESAVGMSTSLRLSTGRARGSGRTTGAGHAPRPRQATSRWPGAPDAQQVPARPGLERNLIAAGVVARPVSVDEAEVERRSARDALPSGKVEIVEDELGEVGDARRNVRLRPRPPGGTDLNRDRL